jgi:hypothetical protein
MTDARARADALAAWLTSPEAKARWIAAARGVWDELLDRPVGALVDAGAVLRAFDRLLSDDALAGAAEPALRAGLPILGAELRADPRKIGDYLPAEARPMVDRLLEMPGLLPHRFLSEVFADQAVEEIMRDVLFDALKEFNEKVNPFFSDWGLPGMLKKLSPFGLGGMGRAAESLRAEFDRRLEPEIRKFLQTFSRRALASALRFAVENEDTPRFIALRKHLAEWILAEKVSGIAPPEGERAELVEAIGALAGRRIAAEARSRTRARIAEELARHEGKTLREALADRGIGWQPDIEAIAEAAFAPFAATLSTDASKRLVAAALGDGDE